VCRSADRAIYTNRKKAKDREAFLKADRDRQKAKTNGYRIKRIQLLTLYGSKCECCSASDFVFLCIDHIDGNGAQERAVLKGYGVYRKLLKAGVRLPGYRILCFNCNFAMGLYGFCPHGTLAPQPSRFQRRMMNDNPTTAPNRDEPADLPAN
jgi:hypothetical protein